MAKVGKEAHQGLRVAVYALDEGPGLLILMPGQIEAHAGTEQIQAQGVRGAPA
jgi:hypothetical protein